MSEELKSLLGFYEDAVKDTQGLLQIIVRRMQQQLTELSIQESQRSIQEAIAVKRLTLLAFVFIHLSFATSIFGMNLNELTGVGPKVWVFVVTSLIPIAPILFTCGFIVVKAKHEQKWNYIKNSVMYWLAAHCWWFINCLSDLTRHGNRNLPRRFMSY